MRELPAQRRLPAQIWRLCAEQHPGTCQGQVRCRHVPGEGSHGHWFLRRGGAEHAEARPVLGPNVLTPAHLGARSTYLLAASTRPPVASTALPALQPPPSLPPTKPVQPPPPPQQQKPAAAQPTQQEQQQKPAANATQPAPQQQKPAANATQLAQQQAAKPASPKPVQPAQQQAAKPASPKPAQQPAKPATPKPAANTTQPAQQPKPAANTTQPAQQQQAKPAASATQPAAAAKPAVAVAAAKTGTATAAAATAALPATVPAAAPSPPVKPVAVAAAAADEETVPQFVPFDVGVTNAAAPNSRFVVLTWAVSAGWSQQLLGFKVRLEQEGAAAGSYTPVPNWDGAVVQTRLDPSRPVLPAGLKQRTITTEAASNTHYRLTIRVDGPTAGPRVRVQIQSALADGSFSTPMAITSAS